MTAFLALLLVLQGDPQIEKIDRVVGNAQRPLLWTPLKVTITSASDFSGDVVASSRFGFSVARAVTIKAGGREVVLLPAIDPVTVSVGKASAPVPKDVVRPDRIVLVDARLPYAADLVSTEKVLYQRIAAEDLEKTLPRGLLEAADLVLVKEGPGTVAATREDAEKAVASLGEHAPCLEAVDRSIWTQAPATGWVPAKRTWTLFFATTYVFAAFVALAVVAKRFPKFGIVCVVGVAALGIAGYQCFPRGHLWVVGQAVHVASSSGEGWEHRLWFVQTATEVPAIRLDFPRLVKPIFPTTGGTDDPFTLRVDDQGCSVEGLRILPRRPACFGGSGRLEPGKDPEGLTRVVTVRNGEVEGGGPVGEDFKAWQRFLGRDGRFGILGSADQPASRVKSTDLADEHDRPPIFIRALK